MHAGGSMAPSGDLGLKVIRASDAREIRERFDRVIAAGNWPAKELNLREIAHYGLPRTGLDDRVNAWRTANFRHLMRGVMRALAARSLRVSHFYGSLYLTHIRGEGEVLELGLASMRVVTTAGVNFIVDAFANTTELENLKYHGLGTGANAEAAADTALQTELTTEYNPNSTRATGSTTEGASANIYRTVGTNTVDASAAVTEHGIFSQAATGGGTLLDRSVFSVVNLASADGLQSTYDLTLAAGS
jgi:hypothetical protein